MGKKDKDDHYREKSHKRHKHHKSSRHHSSQPEKHRKSSHTSGRSFQKDLEDHDDLAQTSKTIAMRPAPLPEEEDNVDIEVEDFAMEACIEVTAMEEEVAEEDEEEQQQPQQQIVEKSKKSSRKPESPQTPLASQKSSTITNNNSNAKKPSKKRRDSGTSSEEERWLTAIESGKLEEVEDVEMRKIKDPKLMTARQRAMYDRNNDTECAPGFAETLIALPTGYKEKEKPQTAEEIQKAAMKSLKRKQQADEKREKDKKKTMERLLKKQESKNRSSAKPKTAKDAQPVISYRNSAEGAVINLPVGVEFPLQPQTPKEPPARQLCGIPGCGQPKVYNCSKTNVPLCSFTCYRKNVQSTKQIIC